MNEAACILVVDDDREIRTLLRDYLETEGLRATAVADGREMRRALADMQFDLVVLDLMLPHEDGLAICRDLRAHSDLPIIMLTALGDEPDRIAGFDVGADDYVAKPFSPRELLRRIRAVLRRAQAAPSSKRPGGIYRFDGWQLDTTTRTLIDRTGRHVELGGARFRLLSVLLERAPRLVGRAELMALVHGRDFDPMDRSVDVRISRLRQTLCDDARAPRIIKTVYGEGYVVGVPVERDDP
jgi:two-component system, OmpR family, response regulator